MKIFKNKQGRKDFDIDPNWWKDRPPGLSCYFRVKNEADFIKPSILSIIDYVDEVVVALQPSVDGTRKEIESIDNPKIRILDYPFKLMPNGPGFYRQDMTSLNSKTYYYNWTLSKTTYNWAVKWDGDMVALSTIAPYLKQRKKNIRFFGHEIVKMEKDGDWFLSKEHPLSNAAPSGMFLVDKDLMYVNGRETHTFKKKKTGSHAKNTFLHFKWCKSHYDDIWNKDWRNMEKFQKLCLRAVPGDVYEGERPAVLPLRDMGFRS